MKRRAVIFDLDGVLLDSKEIHYLSLNDALEQIAPEFVISEEDHKLIYDGLPTKEKLKILTKTKGLPEHLHSEIERTKQDKTFVYYDKLKKDDELIAIFNWLESNYFNVGIATNSIRHTTFRCLERLGLINFNTIILTSSDVENPKPDPEIYFNMFDKLGLEPEECIILEDNIKGKTAAYLSGARVVSINSRKDLTLDKIKKEVNFFKTKFLNIEEKQFLNDELIISKIKNAKVDGLTRVAINRAIKQEYKTKKNPESDNCWGRFYNVTPFIPIRFLNEYSEINPDFASNGMDFYVSGFSENTIKKYDDKNVFILQFTSRYYHIIHEILPKLIMMKKFDPNFHLVLFPGNLWQRVEKSGMFYDLEKEEEHEYKLVRKKEDDASLLRYILDYLNVEYSCIDLLDLLKIKQPLIFKNLYILHEKVASRHQECTDVFERFWPPSLQIETFEAKYIHHYPTQRYNYNNDNLEMDTLYDFCISQDSGKKFPKNIYVSRKNYERNHENQDKLEKYLNTIGYETVCFEDYEIFDQVKMCREADSIVCYLGSSLINVILSRTKATTYIINLDDPFIPNFVDNMSKWYTHKLKTYNIKNSMLYYDNDRDFDFIKSIFDLENNE